VKKVVELLQHNAEHHYIPFFDQVRLKVNRSGTYKYRHIKPHVIHTQSVRRNAILRPLCLCVDDLHVPQGWSSESPDSVRAEAPLHATPGVATWRAPSGTHRGTCESSAVR
jgi:hypothetical protein